MRLGVVIPCYRQERFLPRTVAAIEHALEGRDWRGVLVLAAPPREPLPALSSRWETVVPPGPAPDSPWPPPRRPLTPGAARMLGFARCGGEWVLFVDADVELEPAWVERALQTAEAGASPDSRLAGLWGRLEERFADVGGERPGSPDLYRIGDAERPVDYLATLAFYRRDALLAAGGYEPRLSSEEDFELGLRLRAQGFELRSLGLLAARHWSAPRPSFTELGRRWRTGLCFGQGQVLRLYAGRRGWLALLRRQSLYLAILGLWGLGLVALGVSLVMREARPLALWAVLPLVLLAGMTVRKRSLRLAAHSLLSWTLNAAGLLVGLLRPWPDAGPRPTGMEARC